MGFERNRLWLWRLRSTQSVDPLRAGRRRRPDLEAMESRELLSTITEYPLATDALPQGITTGSNGKGGSEIWFTENAQDMVVSMTASGQIDQQYTVTSAPTAITADGSGNLWFTQFDPSTSTGTIGTINPTTGAYTSANLPSNLQALGIAYDQADGYLWITEYNPSVPADDAIAWINPASFATTSDIHQVALPSDAPSNRVVEGITYDAQDQDLWFTYPQGNALGMYNPAMSSFNSTAITVPTSATQPVSITADNQGNLWFVEETKGAIAEYTPGTGFAGPYALPNESGPVIGQITTGADGDIYFAVGGTTYSQIGSFNPATITASSDITLPSTPSSQAFPSAVAVGPDGNVWFTETVGVSTGPDASNGAIGVLPVTQLSAPAPTGVTANSSFNLTVTDVYQNAPDTADTDFNGEVTISLTSGPGTLAGTLTANATDGVATFTGLTLSEAGSYTIQATGNLTTGSTASFAVTAPSPTPSTPSPTPSTPSPTPSPTPPPTPVVTAEEINLVYLHHNKKGKPTGTPVVSLTFQFSTAMDPATVGNAGNYQVDWTSTKKVKKKVTTVLHPIVFTASYDSSTSSVTLTTNAAKTKFAKGGEVTISSAVTSAQGAALGGTSVFLIGAKAKSVS